MPNPATALCLTGFAILCSVPAAAEIQQVRFAGTLNQSSRSGEELVLRRFEALLIHDAVAPFFAVLDDDREGCPWPESFGRLNTANAPDPHLIYNYDGSTYTLPLPPLTVSLPADAATGHVWNNNGWEFEISEAVTQAGTKAWKIDSKERRGRRQELIVAADSGILLQATQDVFMGQGDRFELRLNQSSAEPISQNGSEKVATLQTRLLQLQAALQRRPDTQIAELSPRQVSDAAAQLETLSTLAKDTPLHETVLRIDRDVSRQARRVAESMKRRDQLLNKAAPNFVLNLINGTSLESDSLRGKAVVLHFWKYSDKPLSEPYGQVGYLEFLFNKRGQTNVAVVGISMNPLLQQNDKARSAVRSARKLSEFMNLSFPIGYDDGSLLRALGDPRDTGGELPLWVVLSPTGNVVHYHSGFYEVDKQHGLKELDDVIAEQISTAAK
ncbi:MAG: TlpA disulfide reductase family protein [Planctomycetaceae bacterium]